MISFDRMDAIVRQFHTLNWAAMAIGIASLLVLIVCAGYFKRIPGAILVCFGAAAAVSILHLSAETSGRVLEESRAGLRILLSPVSAASACHRHIPLCIIEYKLSNREAQ